MPTIRNRVKTSIAAGIVVGVAYQAALSLFVSAERAAVAGGLVATATIVFMSAVTATDHPSAISKRIQDVLPIAAMVIIAFIVAVSAVASLEPHADPASAEVIGAGLVAGVVASGFKNWFFGLVVGGAGGAVAGWAIAGTEGGLVGLIAGAAAAVVSALTELRTELEPGEEARDLAGLEANSGGEASSARNWRLREAAKEREAGRYDDAIASCEEAVTERPTFVPGIVDLAVSYGMRGQGGDLAHAKQLLEQALSIEPDSPLVYANLRTVYTGLDDFSKATDMGLMFDRCLEFGRNPTRVSVVETISINCDASTVFEFLRDPGYLSSYYDLEGPVRQLGGPSVGAGSMQRMDFGLGGHVATEPRRVVLFDRLITDELPPTRIAFRALGNRVIRDVQWDRIDEMNLKGAWELVESEYGTIVMYRLEYALCMRSFWGFISRIQELFFRAKFERTMRETLVRLKRAVEEL